MAERCSELTDPAEGSVDERPLRPLEDGFIPSVESSDDSTDTEPHTHTAGMSEELSALPSEDTVSASGVV